MGLFKIIRVLVLLLIFIGLAFYAQRQKLKSRSWTEPLQLIIYPINAENRPEIAEYISALDDSVFEPIDVFMQQQSQVYGLIREHPTETHLGPEIKILPPRPPPLDAGYVAVMWWGIKFRYWVFTNTPDSESNIRRVRIFVLYHEAADGKQLPHSLGLDKGLVALVHAFASIEQDQQNNIVIAHEFLHTVGATDKYDADNKPVFPIGYADPGQSPLYPQTRAEIMVGRIPLSSTELHMADSLSQCVIGEQTAREINWLH